MMIHGELKNIKKSVLESLEGLYELAVPAGQLVTREIAELMLAVTAELQREVAVYINRQGKVLQVSVGDDATVDLPEIRQRKSENRLSGVRCVHTHPSSDTRLSAPDLSSLRSMRFDVMAAIGMKDGRIYGSMAFLSGELTESGGYVVHGTKELSIGDLNRYNLMQLVTAINKELGRNQLKETEKRQERAILAGVDYNASAGGWSIEDSLMELKGLAETAGAQVAGKVIQRKAKPDNAFFLGRGKVDEIGMLAQNVEADLLIVDDEISPSQQRNLEMSTGLRVVDRTALILDIFAQRARSAAGKLQVELAQLRYNLPRLGGQGLVLSRQGGGIGTRGPGETKLEMDRRRIHGRIHDLEERIAKLKNQRQLHRTQRKNSRIPTAALVGYTNAGKSTLLNALAAGDEVLAEDKLFATLDPTTRLVELDEKQELLLTDTVGFIQKLPHTLVSAFQATLEETVEADLLLHVVDASDANYELQIKAVMEVLKEIGAQDKPSIFVFNKADKLPEAERDNEYVAARMLQGRDGAVISAKDEQGLKMLREKIKGFFNQGQVTLTLCIPYDQGALVTELHNLGKVEAIDYDEQGTLLTVKMPVSDAESFQKYVR
ncbi:MAG: GTPase HflX [Anaerovibrio sp.]|uniref:GTPase HflX n=1 Tax=Anaerovibrio sp. TaxID=1872532 RepID=UPI00261F3F0A|nr:GTPase HflX [Anaerovibrio sp.]MDD7678677.1 GTPase HflX [Anaerovibrio sp.]MDY2604074.1 GTPase HflX [Anaerovibrio sp.]